MGIVIQFNLAQVLIIATALKAYSESDEGKGKHIDCFGDDMSKSLAEMFAGLPAQVAADNLLPGAGLDMLYSFCDAYPADERSLLAMRERANATPD